MGGRRRTELVKALGPASFVCLWGLSANPSLAVADFQPQAEKKQRTDPSCVAPLPFWRRTVETPVERYCELVFKGQASILSDPKKATVLAKEALSLVKSGSRASLLLAYSQLLVGEHQASHDSFEGLLSTAPREMWQAPYVVASARAALLSGQYVIAHQRYREAILRLEQIAGQREQVRVLLEATVAVSYAKRDFLREASTYLRLAESKNSSLLRSFTQALAALTLHRAGRTEEALRQASELRDFHSLQWLFERNAQAHGHPREKLPVLPAGESSALQAVVAEALERGEASHLWEQFSAKSGDSLPAWLVEPNSK